MPWDNWFVFTVKKDKSEMIDSKEFKKSYCIPHSIKP